MFKPLTLSAAMGRFPISGLVALGLAISLPASAVSLTNGSFEDIGSATVSFSINNPTLLPGWDTNPTPSGNNVLNCLVLPSATTALCGAPNGWNLEFWNAGVGGNFPGGASPDGGNFVAIDGDASFRVRLEQTLTGLVVGQNYVVSFYQAAAQQYGFDGATTERWRVSLGTETHDSTQMNTANHGYVGWMSESLTFTAQSATSVLSFLALGTPSGQPPFVLIDGITVNETTETPEPSTFALIGCGSLMIWFGRRRGKR